MKKNTLIISFATNIFLFLFSSCDEVSQPYLQTKKSFPSDTGFIKKILLEDYTGFKCGNCPPSHVEAERLTKAWPDGYGKRIIVLTVHAGYYADPLTPPQEQ